MGLEAPSESSNATLQTNPEDWYRVQFHMLFNILSNAMVSA